MTWVLDGEKIKANRHGKIMTGTVVASRVRYGGDVSYTVKLDEPVQYRWRTEPTDTVLVNHSELILEGVK